MNRLSARAERNNSNDKSCANNNGGDDTYFCFQLHSLQFSMLLGVAMCLARLVCIWQLLRCLQNLLKCQEIRLLFVDIPFQT